MEELELPVLATEIPHLSLYRSAFGETVEDLGDYEKRSPTSLWRWRGDGEEEGLRLARAAQKRDCARDACDAGPVEQGCRD